MNSLRNCWLLAGVLMISLALTACEEATTADDGSGSGSGEEMTPDPDPPEHEAPAEPDPEPPTPATQRLRADSIASSDGLFVVVGEGGGETNADGSSSSPVTRAAGYSLDGDIWHPAVSIESERRQNNFGGWFWGQVIFEEVVGGGGRFVAVGRNRMGETVFYYSTDGKTWEKSTSKIEAPERGYLDPEAQVAYGGNRFVAVGGHRYMTLIDIVATEFFSTEVTVERRVPVFYHSVDGVTWTESSTNPMPTHIGGETYILGDISYGNGRFVARSLGGVLWYSTDGDKWTTVVRDIQSQIEIGGFSPGSITYGPDRFFIVNNTGGTEYSLDGVTWIRGSGIGVGHRFTDVVWGEDRYVAVSICGTVAYSTDGETWKLLGIKASFRSIAWSDELSLFVAVDGVDIFHSADAVTWELAESSPGEEVVYTSPGCGGSSA